MINKMNIGELEHIVDLFTDYVIDQNFIDYIFGEKEDKRKFVRDFYTFYIFHFQENLIRNADDTCAVVLHQPKDSWFIPNISKVFIDFPQLLKIGMTSITKLLTHQSWLNSYRKNLYPDIHYYFDSFAMKHVDETGKIILEKNKEADGVILPIFEEVEKSGLPMLCDTFSEENIVFFEKYGMKLFHEVTMPGGTTKQYYLSYNLKKSYSPRV